MSRHASLAPEQRSSPSRRDKPHRRDGRKVLNTLVENDLIRRVSFDEYRQKVQRVYDGPKGAMLSKCSRISGHLTLGERLLKQRKFNLSGMSQILDVGSGAGQVLGHLLKYADPGAKITATDLSHAMLRRAKKRLKSHRPDFVTADITRLPFADETFDGVTCCYVLEHLPDARLGLSELSRVMMPGGRLLVFTSEDTFSGAWTSRMWACRTYNRAEFLKMAEEERLLLRQELWFTRIHRVLRAGGICVELEKR